MGAYKRDVVAVIKMGAYIHGVLILCGCLLYTVRQTGRQSYLVVSQVDGSSGSIPQTISAAPHIVVGVVHLVVVVMVRHEWQLATCNNPGARGKTMSRPTKHKSFYPH